MRRQHGHLIFAAATAAFSVVTGAEILRLVHAEQVNSAINDCSPLERSLPEGRLSRAVALAKKDYDGALATYKAIVQSGREDLRRIALYDLGNLHLQQALRVGQSDEEQSLPLIELAKQSYRDELRRNPNDWDARYNLERALRLAPEEDEDYEDTGPPAPKEQERSTIADPRMDLP
jgi:mxaK protein